MSYVDLSTPPFALSIAGLTCSSQMVLFDVGDDAVDESGLVLCQGNLKLAITPGFTESGDDRINPRWSPGGAVLLDINDSTGTLQRHPRGYLRIVKSSFDPVNGMLDLAIADSMAFAMSQAPANDKSGVVLGTNTTRTAIVNALLSAAGAPALIDSIDSYPINYPLPRVTGGYVEMAGEIAANAGYFLWVDKLNRVRAKKIALRPPTRLLWRVLGRGEAYFARNTGIERPPNKVICSGVAYSCKTPDGCTTNYKDEYPNGWTRETDCVFAQLTKRIQTLAQARPLGTTMPDFYPNSTRVWPTPSFRSRTETIYELPTALTAELDPDNQRRRRKEIYEEWGQIGIVLKSWLANNKAIATPLVTTFQLCGEIKALERNTDWIYRDLRDGQIGEVLQIRYTYRQPIGVVDPSYKTPVFSAVLNLVDSGIKTQTWLKLAQKNTWKLVSEDYQSLALLKPDAVQASKPSLSLAARIALTPNPDAGANGVQISSSGQLMPASPERLPPDVTLGERQVSSYVRISSALGGFGDKLQTYDLKYLVGESGDFPNPLIDIQLQEIAQLRAGLITGRYNGCKWQTDLDDAWFDYEPLSRIDFAEGGQLYAYLADAVTWTVSQQRTVVGGLGILSGAIATDTPVTDPTTVIPDEVLANITPIYTPISGTAGGVRIGGGSLNYPYDITPVTLPGTAGGIRVGGASPLIGFVGGVRIGGGSNLSGGGGTDPYSIEVLADFPVLYLRLDDFGSTAADSSGTGYSSGGTYSGTYSQGQTGAVSGNSAIALGSDGMVTVPDFPEISLGSDFTIEFWLNGGSSNSGICVSKWYVDPGTSQVSGFKVQVLGNVRTEFADGSGLSGSGPNSSSFSDDDYHHIVIRNTAGTFELIVDTVLQDSPYSPGVISNSAPLVIGATSDTGGASFTGAIDELAVYGTALDDTRIAAHFAAV